MKDTPADRVAKHGLFILKRYCGKPMGEAVSGLTASGDGYIIGVKVDGVGISLLPVE